MSAIVVLDLLSALTHAMSPDVCAPAELRLLRSNRRRPVHFSAVQSTYPLPRRIHAVLSLRKIIQSIARRLSFPLHTHSSVSCAPKAIS